MHDTRREIPAFADPIYRPPPKPTEISPQVIPRKLMDLGIDALNKILTWIVRKIPHIKKV